MCIANVHTGFLMKTRTLSETGLQATPRQKKKKNNNLSTFCPWPESSGGRLSLKVLDKLEAKEKQPSFQNRFFYSLFFIIIWDFLTMNLDHVSSQFLPLISRFCYPQICVFFYLLFTNTLSPMLFMPICVGENTH